MLGMASMATSFMANPVAVGTRHFVGTVYLGELPQATGRTRLAASICDKKETMDNLKITAVIAFATVIVLSVS